MKAKLLSTSSLRTETNLVAGNIVDVVPPDDIPENVKEVMAFYASITTVFELVAIYEDGGSRIQLIPDFQLELLPTGEEV